ncbi:uncharacterized protein [Aegilops tauschii subsp. strangulata]|uniref:uncharacterized protein n=1 Tax=Aegilops tauschii subsp. strangulata TaxID=200361 RepID=UPI003CC891E7
MSSAVYHGIRSFNGYFILKKDAVGKIGFSGAGPHCEYLHMTQPHIRGRNTYGCLTESTYGDAMVRFATVVVFVFGPQYLREPTVANTERILAMSEARGWSDLLRSLDCMHLRWKNCPKALQGQYQGHFKKSTIIVESSCIT